MSVEDKILEIISQQDKEKRKETGGEPVQEQRQIPEEEPQDPDDKNKNLEEGKIVFKS